MVPVGEGIGEEKAESGSGMLIFRGARSLAFGGLGTRLGASPVTRDANEILIFVDGKRSTQLK